MHDVTNYSSMGLILSLSRANSSNFYSSYSECASAVQCKLTVCGLISHLAIYLSPTCSAHHSVSWKQRKQHNNEHVNTEQKQQNLKPIQCPVAGKLIRSTSTVSSGNNVLIICTVYRLWTCNHAVRSVVRSSH